MSITGKYRLLISRLTQDHAGQFQLLGRRAKLGLMLLTVLFLNVVWYLPMHSSAVGTNMLLLWDPGYGSTPTGWTVVTTYDGRFPRGETPGNFGVTGGATSAQTPTTNTITVGAPSIFTTGVGNNLAVADGAHAHGNPTVTVGADSNAEIPAFRSYQLIKFNTGIPTSIPAGAIVMFDTSSTLPTGFTRISANDSRVVRVDSTVATGGSDTETNTVAISALPASGSVPGATNNTNTTPVATPTHGHLAPANGSTTAVSTLPPYVEPLLAQANATTATIPDSLTAMFDGDPGVGWAIQSNSGGTYYQQFIRPAATPNLTSQGSTTHTAPTYAVQSGASDTASAVNTKTNGGGTGAALQTHTHLITVTFNSVTSIPGYFNVVIAQKVSFTLQAYRWYVDPNTENVTDPWPSGALNIAQNTILPAVPVQYLAPFNSTQLRLRMQILLSGKALPASSIQFKTQYKQGTDGDCTTGTWTDVAASGGGGAWTYGTNTVTDGTTLTASQLSPASSVLERFMKSATSGTNPNAAAVGQTVEYDVLLKNNTAADGSQYSFRIIEDSGQPLSVYSVCPDAVTKPQITQEMRHGEFFQDGVDQGFAWAD